MLSFRDDGPFNVSRFGPQVERIWVPVAGNRTAHPTSGTASAAVKWAAWAIALETRVPARTAEVRSRNADSHTHAEDANTGREETRTRTINFLFFITKYYDFVLFSRFSMAFFFAFEKPHL